MTNINIFAKLFREVFRKKTFHLDFSKPHLYLWGLLADVEPKNKYMITTRKVSRTVNPTNYKDFWLGCVVVMVALINLLNAVAIIWG